MKTLALSFLITVSLCAQTARYPTALAGDSDLAVVANRLTTKLAFPMGAADTQMIVASATGIVPNMILTIDPSGERVFVCAVAGTTLSLGKSSCPNADGRGFDGTTAAAHANKAAVSNYIGHWEFTQHSKEIQALEAALGVNLANSKPPPGPAYTAASYTFSQSPGGSLSPGNNVISVSPCPAGANGTDTGHYVALSGGTGATEGALITGGTCTSGANSGTLIVNAAGAHSGAWTIQSATGGIQEAVNSLPASGGTIDVAAPVTIRGNAQIYLPAWKDLYFRGAGWAQALITSTSNKTLFAFPSTNGGRRLRWEGLGFSGGAGILNMDNTQNSSIEFVSNYVTLQTDTAIRLGNSVGSVYINRIRDNYFFNNNPASGTTPIVWIYVASDTRIENNFWLWNSGAPLQIDSEDVMVDNNYFISDCSSLSPEGHTCPQTTPYDILVTPTTAGRFGWIINNKFGSEDEVAAHLKIQFGTAALQGTHPEYFIGEMWITNNQFGTATSGTVIKAYHRCLYCVIRDNVATNVMTWYDDADTAASTYGVGDSTFADNLCYSLGNGSCTPFTNGGHGFTTFRPAPGQPGIPREVMPYRSDSTLVQNLLSQSENFSTWLITNVTVGSAVTGPFGDLSAYPITGTGTTNQNIAQAFMATANSVYNCSIWLKAGTESLVMLRVIDAGTGLTMGQRSITLSSDWQRYQVTGFGNASGHYIGCYLNMKDSSTGTINAFGAQGEQFPIARDYVKTAGADITSTIAMRTFPRLVSTGVGSALTITSNTIAPTFMMHHVGAGLIKTITRPPGFNGCITLIPDAAFTWDTSANIATTGGAASVGVPVFACFDTAAWYLK